MPVARKVVIEQRERSCDGALYAGALKLVCPLIIILGVDDSPCLRLLESVACIPLVLCIATEERRYASPLPKKSPRVGAVLGVGTNSTHVAVHKLHAVGISHCRGLVCTPDKPSPYHLVVSVERSEYH